LALLTEYTKEIDKSMVNATDRLGNSQIGAVSNRIRDMLTQFIISKANEIAEKFLDEKLVNISRAVPVTRLQFMLSAVSATGHLCDSTFQTDTIIDLMSGMVRNYFNLF
jgi:hypothetical protein